LTTTTPDTTAPPTSAGAPAHLLSSSTPNGASSQTGEPAWTARDLEEADLGAFRRLAEADGRVLEREGLALLTLGEAARIELPHGLRAEGAAEHAAGLLASIPPRSDAVRRVEAMALGERDVPGPFAVGALPFDPAASAHLVVPELTVLLRPGAGAVGIACGEPGRLDQLLAGFPFAAGVAAPRLRRLAPAPDRFELAAVRSHEEFEELVTLAVAEIARGSFEKVVCAREVLVTANRPFEQAHLLERLRALYPACAVFALEGFVGASPELLVRRSGDEVTSEPLAGTIPRSGDPEEDARLASRLLASPKERHEHALVVSAIERALAGLGADVRSPGSPHLLELRNVSHLATTISARLRSPLPGVLAIVAALAPTPAVGGVPTAAAMEFLAAHERLQRDRYAGPVGYVDAAGDGEWWLGLRSAMVRGRTARLIAGAGIVEGSEPHDELVETQLKLQALLAAAVRP
jgi:menaquinone-specific isochorismate synthase